MNTQLSYEEYVATYSRVPRLNVELIVHTPEGVLLTKRAIEPWRGMWHVPGGRINYGESFESALERIALKELGSGIKSSKLIGYIDYPSAADLTVFVGWPMGVAFLVELKQEVANLNEEAELVEYFKTLPDDLISDQRTLLEKVLKAEL